jgi:hypothetical protein
VIWHWLNTSSPAIQAIASVLNFLALAASVGATIALVRYTRRYVSLTQSTLEQQQRDNRRRVNEALRALLVELKDNQASGRTEQDHFT